MKIKLIAFLFTFIITTITFGQINGYNFWTSIDEKNISRVGTRQIYPNKYKTFSLTNTLLKEKLFSAPNENEVNISRSSCIVSLPLPNGQFQRFSVVESPIMQKELALSFSQIKTL